MLVQSANALLCLLLVIIIFRESKKFSIETSILCTLLGFAALIIQTLKKKKKWTQ